MSKQDPPETVRLTLLPSEGRSLFGLLTELTECGDPEADFSGLEALLDKVGDANALALWLREYVNVELEEQEAAKVREILNSMSSENGVSPDADTVFPGIQTILAEYLPGGDSAAKI